MPTWKEWSEKEVKGKTVLLWAGGLLGTPIVLALAQPPLRGMIVLGLICVALYYVGRSLSRGIVTDMVARMNKAGIDGAQKPSPRTNRAIAWTVLSIPVLIVLGLLGSVLPKGSIERGEPTAQDLANGIYAATVIRCYQMNDMDLLLNQTLCRDALRRMPASR